MRISYLLNELQKQGLQTGVDLLDTGCIYHFKKGSTSLAICVASRPRKGSDLSTMSFEYAMRTDVRADLALNIRTVKEAASIFGVK